MAKSYKLTYFPGRGGGEICRLTLSAAGIEFEDERISGEEWQKRKPGMPMKSLPVLTVKTGDEEKVYCQSSAIAKFFAREHGLLGSNKEQNFLVEEVYDSVMDTQRELFKFFFEKDETKKAEAKKTITDVVIPKLHDYINLRTKQYGQGGYIIGSQLSLADITLFNMVDGVTLRGESEFWKGCDSLQKHYDLVKSNPKIAAWLAKRPKSEF